MTFFVYAPPGKPPIFGASLETLKVDYPNTDFPPFITVEQKAEFNLYPVTATEPPVTDPATQRIAPADPPAVLVDGLWQQAWQLVELSQEEQETLYQSTHPPRWTDFVLGASQDPTIDAWLVALPKVQSLLLSGSLATASLGHPDTLLKSLAGLRHSGAMPLPVSEALRQHAIASDLPSDIMKIFV